MKAKNRIIGMRGLFHTAAVCVFVFLLIGGLSAATENKELYDQIKALEFDGKTANVDGLVVQIDRVKMTFTGTFYFGKAVGGRVSVAVFEGTGLFYADAPPAEFEKDNLIRLVGEDHVSQSFKRAVFRYSDESFGIIRDTAVDGPVNSDVAKEAKDHEERMLEETGMNLSERILISIANKEQEGLFTGTFEGGKDRFSFVYDPYKRIPTGYFDINGGERGLIYEYDDSSRTNDVWTAFYGIKNYETGYVAYSDAHDLVDIRHYDMDIDLRDPDKRLGLKTTIELEIGIPDVAVIPFFIGESLGEYRDSRLKKQMRVQTAKLNGADVEFIQEDWQSGFVIFLPETKNSGEILKLELELDGDFLRGDDFYNFSHYPRSNSTWYPRHGYLDRTTFDFRYSHKKKTIVASVGDRISEAEKMDEKDVFETVYKVKDPIALATFAVGKFVRYEDKIKWEDGTEPTLIEFNSLPDGVLRLKEEFILAEMSNSVRYFHSIFGKYPYPKFSATFHPYSFGQGFASMLMIPATDNANKYTYAFISHETAHQWWGNIVSWRSYRDQWLSEGFAEYSGVLYARLRDSPKAADNLLKRLQSNLKDRPRTETGIGKGRVNDLGPLILGHRLDSRKSRGAYSTLVYDKGALVLRMIHYLFTNPSDGKDELFIEMMRDFVVRYSNKSASTDDFLKVANEHFVKTTIAKKYNLKGLNWFFSQWVHRTNLPSYQMNYSYIPNEDGSVIFEGEILQEGVDQNWFMPVPVTFRFGKDQVAYITLPALGEKTPFRMKIPKRPSKTELDPMRWLLADEISEKEVKPNRP